MADQPSISPHRFCVAPMIDWTDRFCRFFHRQLSQRALLYTEMIVDEAILRGDRNHLLGYDPAEHPVALQLGGSDPHKLAEAAKIGADFGYVEINLNVGCPSDRVQSGRFGACLMTEPDLVARCLDAMQASVPNTAVTAKCRIGVDDQEPEHALPAFLKAVTSVGIQTIIVHARKAWLQGLSPKENRTIPPLDYELVADMAGMFPDATLILNGGIANLDEAQSHLDRFPGVMLGRAAYERPYLLAHVDRDLFGENCAVPSRLAVVEAVGRHFDALGVRTWAYARHMLGLFHGAPGARQWRRVISEQGRGEDVTGEWLIQLASEITALAKDEVTGGR